MTKMRRTTAETNLLEDRWMPVSSGIRIAPWQITEHSDRSEFELDASRADFQGALYQFLIGLLQTCVPPEDDEHWVELYFSPPSSDELRAKFQPYAGAFNLINEDGPAFLQDFDLTEGEQKPISTLLIDAPGAKTLKDNLDLFVKGDSVSKMCPSCAAIALFTLQTNAPSGGQGHRTGLRGGGPLTTLLVPGEQNASLWQKLWLNVLSEEDFRKAAPGDSTVFPWLAATRCSDKSGMPTFKEDVNPLQMYWGMPRRIRFEPVVQERAECDLCGENVDVLVTHYRTKNFGVNYEGIWDHPLSPYRLDPQNKKPPICLKGQKGGLGYRHWLGMNWRDDSNGDSAAKVAAAFNHSRIFELRAFSEQVDFDARIWCFGFDMDNMKARCWHDQQMPVTRVADGHRETFIQFVDSLVQAARDTLQVLRSQIKSAWFDRPGDVKGDTSMIDESFWERTESTFYGQLKPLSIPSRTMPWQVAETWGKLLRHTAFQLFDHWAMEGTAEDLDLSRIVKSRLTLNKKMKTLKSLKELDGYVSANKEVKK